MKKPVISYRAATNSIYFYIGFIAAIIILACIFLLKLISASGSIVPLQVMLTEETSVVAPEPQATENTIDEQNLIASLMQDVELPAKSVPSGWKRVKMRVTGYCPCSQCCGEFSDGITANNHHIQPRDVFVAADKSYPFGTEVIIPGYNSSRTVLVMDRGGAIKGNHLDAFFHTHQEALEWGVQDLDILVKVQ